MTNPNFVDIQHPDLAPSWVKEGLDQIYDRVGNDITNIGFSFWVDHYYCDNHSYTPRADFFVRLNGNNLEENECRLDEIPAMRRLDRRSAEMWHCLPLSYDSEGNVLGESDYIIKPGHVEFSTFNDGEDLQQMRMVAEFVDGAWQCYDEITLYAEISETLRATATPERLFEAVDITGYSFDDAVCNAEIISGEIDENDAIVLRFKPGLFKHYQASGERDDV